MKAFFALSVLLASYLPLDAVSAIERKQEVADFIKHHGVEKITAAAEKVARNQNEKGAAKWVAPLHELKPIRAYTDRVNLVVVLREDSETEEGLYVMLPISSHIPVDSDSWLFTPQDAPVCHYQRKK